MVYQRSRGEAGRVIDGRDGIREVAGSPKLWGWTGARKGCREGLGELGVFGKS